MRGWWLGLPVLASASCAGLQETPEQAPPEIAYNCDEKATTPDGRFEAGETGFLWSREFGDGLSFGISNFIGVNPEDFVQKGFAAAYGAHLEAEFDKRFAAPEYNAGSLRGPRTASSIAVGGRHFRQWVPVNLVHIISWEQVQCLLQEPGDLIITLYGAEGAVLQRAIVPRDDIAKAEQQLKAMFGLVLEKERDKEKRCEAYEVQTEEIVVT